MPETGLPVQLTTYEFLRILMPGYYAAASVMLHLWLFENDLAIRLAGNPALFTMIFVFAGFFLGFLIYAVDWPSRRAVFEERKVLGDFIIERAKACALGPKLPLDEIKRYSNFVYWLILDTDVPPERRQRVYYFGSIYRLYADVRAITILTIGAIAATVAFELLQCDTCRGLCMIQFASTYIMPILMSLILLGVYVVLTICNKGDKYWRDAITSQLLWLRLHSDVVDKTVCK